MSFSDVDKIADLMDDIQEQQDIANEISEAISNPVSFGADVDEDELLAELDELEQVRVERATYKSDFSIFPSHYTQSVTT